MTRERLPERTSIPLRERPAPRSSPLVDVQIFRPGPLIALVILLLPVIVALSGAAVYLNVDGAIPPWLPFTLLLWAPCLPALWFTMQSVRTSATGIEVGRPWKRWDELRWEDIERVERRGPLLRLVSSHGQDVMFAPMLLHDGGRLKRQLLLRLPAHVLTGHLAVEAQRLLMPDIYSTPQGGYAGVLTTHARLRWRLLLVLSAVGAGAVAYVASGDLAPVAAGATVAVAVALGLSALVVAGWLSQAVLIADDGISVVMPIIRRKRRLKWEEIELIEHTPHQAMLRLRGKRRVVCAGPGMLTPTQATLMRGMLFENCAKRGIPILRRLWIV